MKIEKIIRQERKDKDLVSEKSVNQENFIR